MTKTGWDRYPDTPGLHTTVEEIPVAYIARILTYVEEAMDAEGIPAEVRERIRNRFITGSPERPATIRRARAGW